MKHRHNTSTDVIPQNNSLLANLKTQWVAQCRTHTHPNPASATWLYVIGILKIKLYCYRGGRGGTGPHTIHIINSFGVVFTVITLLVEKLLLFILYACVRVLFYLFLSAIRLFFGPKRFFLYKNGGWCVLWASWLMLNMLCCGGYWFGSVPSAMLYVSI